MTATNNGFYSSTAILPHHAQYLEAIQIAEKHRFNLITPADDAELPEKKFRLERKAIAIACCCTNMTKEEIMKHLQNEFDKLIQYICISSPSHESQTSSPSPIVFIQIILRKRVNKKTRFLKAVAGKQCNYRVTRDDLAWNFFLKKVGLYIEGGKFQSVSSRTGTKWSASVREKHKEKRRQKPIHHIQHQIIKNQKTADQVAENILTNLKKSSQEAINLANTQIPTEREYERNQLLNRLTTVYCLVHNHINQ